MNNPDTAWANVLSRFHKLKRQGKGWVACCPAHDDTRPSLGIDEGYNRDLVFYCRSGGCSTEKILQAVGLTWSDIRHPDSRSNYGGRPPDGERGRKSPGQPLRKKDDICHDKLTRWGELYVELLKSPDRDARLIEFAREHGTCLAAVKALGFVFGPSVQSDWDDKSKNCTYSPAFLIPETAGASNAIVGFNRRLIDGTKKICKDTQRGLIYPPIKGPHQGLVVSPEGASDGAAMLTAGVFSVARPAATRVGSI